MSVFLHVQLPAIFKHYADICRDEWPKALLLSSFFFLVIGIFWVIKPLKRGLIIGYFAERPLVLPGITVSGAEAEQIAKLLNVVFAYLLVLLFTWLTRKYIRYRLVLILSAICAAGFVLFALLVRQPNALVVWAFYVFGDMYNTAMVVLFWAFTDDLASAGEAKRTYGIVGLGGVLGGFFGATTVSTLVEDLGRAPLLVFCVLPMLAIAVIALVLWRLDRKFAADREAAPPPKTSGNIAVEGARLVLRSRYLLSIAGIVALYELVSNIVDFQLAATVERMIAVPLERDSFFALVGQATGIISIAVQALLTSFVLTRFGVRIALLFLPLTLAAGSLGFLLSPVLVFAGLMSVSDNALNYSINQSAKEVLYAPTAPEWTYRAKAFIDMFVQRGGKMLSVGLNLAVVALLPQGVRWLSLFAIAMGVLWVLLIWNVGREFKVKARRQEETQPA